MQNKISKRRIQAIFYIVVIGFILFIPLSSLYSTNPLIQEEETEAVEEVAVRPQENTACFQCHGARKYTMYSADSTAKITKIMPEAYHIDTIMYYNGTHTIFACSDCHSTDYASVPHNGQLRFEPMPGCLDCHGDDPEYAEFHFEEIQEQVQQSVHIERLFRRI